MIHVGKPTETTPERCASALQARVYAVLRELSIPFVRVDTDDAITMDDCVAIAAALQTPVVKTLLLCNRQQTDFYLFVTTADKPFSTKFFSRAMGISRVSFASAAQLEALLGTKVGAASVLGLLHDEENRVRLVFDRQALEAPWYGCTDTTTRSYMKLPTRDMLDRFLPYTHHEPTMIDIEAKPTEET